MNKQLSLAVLLFVQTFAIIIYTFYVITNEGTNFVYVALQNVQSINWNGQFILDFNCYLMLSVIWIMWRGKYRLNAILIAIVAMIMGIIVFAPYLLYLLVKEQGNIPKVLLGERALYGNV